MGTESIEDLKRRISDLESQTETLEARLEEIVDYLRRKLYPDLAAHNIPIRKIPK
jgi:chaperonin cofactor prefoldin